MATIPALIELEPFQLVQAKLKQNRSFAVRNNKRHEYLLRALLSCGHCQSSCTARSTGTSKHRYYVCAAKGKAIHSRKLEKCSARFAPAAQLDELVWQDLCEVLWHPESISQALERAHGDPWLAQELQARRDNLDQAQASLENQNVRLTDAYLAKVIPLAEYQRRRTELETKLTGLQQLGQQLVSPSEQHIKLKQLTNSITTFCSRIQQGLSQASFEQRRQLVEILIDRVIVTDDKVDIRYAIPLTPESETVRFCHLRSDYRHYAGVNGGGLALLSRHHRWFFQTDGGLCHG